MSIDEIRARCGASITEMVSGPKEYGQSQQIIRDRAVLLAAYDALAAELAKEKGGWDAFYKLRRSVGEDRYPGMVGEVTASEREATK